MFKVGTTVIYVFNTSRARGVLDVLEACQSRARRARGVLEACQTSQRRARAVLETCQSRARRARAVLETYGLLSHQVTSTHFKAKPHLNYEDTDSFIMSILGFFRIDKQNISDNFYPSKVKIIYSSEKVPCVGVYSGLD